MDEQQSEPTPATEKRGRSRIAVIVIAVLLVAASAPIVYRQVIFQRACEEMAEQRVFEQRSGVDGLLIVETPAWDSSWTNWLVAKGGYNFVEHPRANSFGVVRSYQRVFWRPPGHTAVETDTASKAAYAIRVSRTFPREFIAKWEFDALDRSNNKILGKKVVLFLQASVLSRSCPNVSASGGASADLFDFFAKQVLIPHAR